MRATLIRFSLMLGATLLACACDQGKPNDRPEEQADAERRAATQPAPHSAIEIGDPLAGMKKRADAGDVSAMITLGRTYESLGTPAGKEQARQWYEKAAAAGDASAAEALHNLQNATTQPAIASAADLDPGRQALAAATNPSVAIVPDGTTPGAGSAGTAATSQPTTNAGRDLSHLRWQEVLESVDTKDFVSVANPSYTPKKGVVPPAFFGLCTAPDKTLMIAGTGPTGDDIQAVRVVFRLRNRQDLSEAPRVKQAAAVARVVTRDNVGPKELVDWVAAYLANGVRSEPVFRNGWRVQVSGSAGEGMSDPNAYLGTAVLVELKK